MSKKIVITGADGFLGWHTRCFFYTYAPEWEVVPLSQENFTNTESRAAALKGAAVIIHLAGMNRGGDNEVYETNVRLMRELLETCGAVQAKPQIIFSSSVHINRDTAYGKAKKEAGRLLTAWAAENKTAACILVLPNIFGEEGRPNYNSAVATFCHELVNNQPSAVNAGAPITLIHAPEVAGHILAAIKNHTSGELLISGRETTVGAVYDKLKEMSDLYKNGLVPACADNFELALFNTLRSAFFCNGFYPQILSPKSDERGSLFEVVKEKTGGQLFFSNTHPGITRGHHYHTRKIERFCVAAGTAEIRVQKLFSDQVNKFTVSGDAPVFIDMPTFYSHAITNIGTNNCLTLFWCNEVYNSKDPDTFLYKIL